jgi:hypothetical protein
MRLTALLFAALRRAPHQYLWNGEACAGKRVINEKRLLLIMVRINIILSCGKEYVKLAWEFICKPGQENLDFLQVKKIEMTQKTKTYCIY